jgi:hypothetical protein
MYESSMNLARYETGQDVGTSELTASCQSVPYHHDVYGCYYKNRVHERW